MGEPIPPANDSETARKDAASLDFVRSLPAFAVDPELREWSAPSGLLGSAAGVTASFRALGMRSVVKQEDGTLLFEAWRHPRWSGALLAAALGGVLYAVLARAGVHGAPIAAAVILVAFYVPMAVLPSYRVAGKIAGGKVELRLRVQGAFGRRRAFERALRFYLEREGGTARLDR